MVTGHQSLLWCTAILAPLLIYLYWPAVLHPAVYHIQNPTLCWRYLTSQTYGEGLHFRCRQPSRRHRISYSMGKTLQLAFKHPKDYWFLDSFTHLPLNSGLSSPESLQWPTLVFLFPVTSPGQPTLTPYVAKPNSRLDCCIGTFMLEVHPAKLNSTSH